MRGCHAADLLDNGVNAKAAVQVGHQGVLLQSLLRLHHVGSTGVACSCEKHMVRLKTCNMLSLR